jgi:hypothetical protein
MTTKTKRELRQLDLIFCDVKRFSQLNYLPTVPQGPHNEKERHPPQISQINQRAILKFEKKRES